MGRKLFLNHLADSSRLSSNGVHDVRSPDEGIVTFTYIYPLHPFHKVDIQACATDLGEYPDGNSFMLCTEDDTPLSTIPNALQRLTDSAHGKLLTDLLSEVSESLTTAISTGHSLDNTPDEGAQDDNDFDFDFEEDSDHGFFGPADRGPVTSIHEINPNSSASFGDDTDMMAKIRSDLNALKTSGFRVGVFGSLASSGILCVSIRISKLGLSDEALEAWSIPRTRYLVLLIRYLRGYRDATRIADVKDLSNSMQMKVGLCEHYKPSLNRVLSLFQHATPDSATLKKSNKTTAENDHLLEPLFIGKALDQFLEERLFKIISTRHACGLMWLGAEKFIWERQASASTSSIDDLERYHGDDVGNAQHLPPIVLADHLDQVPLQRASLPLIIMQFVLRHTVRCTEFCLVCHCRVDESSESFEALKPYVCLKPLCLFQYLALGFGPSLEWEIITQPYVVDLLVCFCYAAALGGRLKELPVGMNLMVPITRTSQVAAIDSTMYPRGYQQQQQQQQQQQEEDKIPHTPPVKSFSCTWDMSTQILVVKEDEDGKNAATRKSDEEATKKSAAQKVKAGDWLVLTSEDGSVSAHCRVEKVHLPQISVHRPILVHPQNNANDESSANTAQKDGQFKFSTADCYLYDKNFDDLSGAEQRNAILVLLDTLPGVIPMRQFLGRTKDSSLKSWSDRVSDSALNLLRWIVASNRSCILQVDEICGDDGSKITGRPEDRVGGMDAWMQFRFAQGAPDKEKRFNKCVKEQAASTTHPTLFAWHGSRIGNWHSIIRQGLHFGEVVNGRAFGNGIYMSNDATTSIGYSRPLGYGYGNSTGMWRPSALKLSQVLSLQEVVNNPVKFVSSQPHYVVADIDWVQTRYLFIPRKAPDEPQESVSAVYKQDPARLVYNELRTAISIPITAISKSRRPGDSISETMNSHAKRKRTSSETDQAIAERRDEDADSGVSDAEDLELLQHSGEKYDLTMPESEANIESPAMNGGKKRPAETTPETDFVPGTLDLEGIKFMTEPQDATPTATKALMRLLKEALNVQENAAPADLGWYIDRNLVSNMYQWVVEMHSFPPELPLAEDMKAAGLMSIVMEMRFTSQYPYSPPFIRVVKPRFLSFQQGGGGNVTDGGAMCAEVLTSSGWSAGLTIESLLLQVRLLVSDTERPARLARRSRNDGQSTYGIGEAIVAYVRACQVHGWTVPAGFSTMQQ